MTRQRSKTRFDLIWVVAFLLLLLNNTSIVHAGTAFLSWDANPISDQVAGYRVYFGTASGSYGSPIDVGNQTSYSVEGLTPGTYFFVATAYDAAGNESGFSFPEVSKTIFASDVAPPVLSGMSAENISSTAAVITWTTNEGATSTVEYGTTTSYTSSSQSNVLVTSHSRSIFGLAPSTRYNYRVISADADGNIATSGNFTFMTSPGVDTVRPALSVISASNVSSTTATITWTTNEGASSRVEYGPTQSYGSSSQSSVLVTNHSRSLLSLAPSITYNYRVISTDAVGNTATSGNFTFTTTADAASDPQQLISNLVVANGKPYGVIQNGLSNDVLTYIDRFHRYSSIPVWLQGAAYIKPAMDDKLSQGLSFLSFDVNQPVTVYIAYLDAYQTKPNWLVSFADTGDNLAVNGNTFSIFQKEFPSGTVILGGNVHPNETSEYSMYTVFVLQANAGSTDLNPPVLSSINVSNITSTGAVITWTTNEAATSKVDFGLTTSYGASSQAGAAFVGSHRQALSGLSSSTRYNYRVISADASGNKRISGNFTFTTGSNLDISPPLLSLISEENITEDSTIIRWGTDEPATSQVEFGLTIDYGQSVLSQTLSINHQQILSQLQPGTPYHYRLKSIDASGNVSISNDRIFLSAEGSGTLSGGESGTNGDVAPLEEILNFNAFGKNREISLSWVNPLDPGVLGVRILFRTDRFPRNIKDGELLGDFSGKPGENMVATHVGMKNGVTYYYLAATYDSQGNFQPTVFVSGTSGFQRTGDRGDESSTKSGGCGMIRPGSGKPPGPGEAAEMIAMLGIFLLIWAKKGLKKYYRFSIFSGKVAH